MSKVRKANIVTRRHTKRILYQHFVGAVRSHGPPGRHPCVLSVHRPDGMGAPLHLPQHEPDRTHSKPPGTEAQSLPPSHPRTGSGVCSDPGRLPTAYSNMAISNAPFFASSDPASETAAELTLQQGWPVRKPRYANGGRPTLSLREHPMAMAPCSAVQLAGLQHRAKCVWWPRPPKTVATTQIAPPLTLTLKHTGRIFCGSSLTS